MPGAHRRSPLVAMRPHRILVCERYLPDTAAPPELYKALPMPSVRHKLSGPHLEPCEILAHGLGDNAHRQALQLRRNRERSGEFWQKIPERLTPAGRRSTSTRRAQLGGIVLRGLRSPPRCTTRHCRLGGLVSPSLAPRYQMIRAVSSSSSSRGASIPGRSSHDGS